jgi:hypothetical protein
LSCGKGTKKKKPSEEGDVAGTGFEPVTFRL